MRWAYFSVPDSFFEFFFGVRGNVDTSIAYFRPD